MSTAAAGKSRRAPFLARRSAEIGMAILVALAIVLRLQPILVAPSAVWPDEIFQASEPAHRLVFGSGLVAWEFQLGVRSWLLPGIIAGLMELSRIVGDGPDYYLPVIAVGFAVLAAAPVVCCETSPAAMKTAIVCWLRLHRRFFSSRSVKSSPPWRRRSTRRYWRR